MIDSIKQDSLSETTNPEDYLQNFGLTSLFSYQRAIIEEICVACGVPVTGAGSEAPSRGLILLPTGAGKSICYMLPALVIPGYSLIIYPLNALISDQLQRFRKAGVRVFPLVGGTSKREKLAAISEAADGEVRVLLANPESILDRDIQKALRKSPPRHLVFDEAHTSAEWGLSFRPAYVEVCSFVRELDPRRVSAFTATASPELLPQMAGLIFGKQGYSLYSRSPAKENIAFSAIPSISPEADLVYLAESCLETPMIIFCRRRRDAEDTARLLASRSSDAAERVKFYHAGLSKEEKQQVENWFMQGGDLILCATCAFGLGVDCAGIRSVVHRGLPPSVEAYVQESGRAGRDGKPCRAVVLFEPDDLAVKFESSRDTRYGTLVKAFLSNKRCRRESLMSLFSPHEEHAACGICDVCTGSIQFIPRGSDEIVGLVREYSSMLSCKEVSDIVKGYRPEHLGGAAGRSSSFGILGTWDYNWCQEAVGSLLSCGALYRKRFSRRLSAGPSRKNILKEMS